MGGGAGAVAGCRLARAARLFTTAWAMTEAIICELEAQETQKKLLLLLLFAEGTTELRCGCWCGRRGAESESGGDTHGAASRMRTCGGGCV